MDKRDWRVKIGIDTHWITEEEKNFYVEAIHNGEELVSLRKGCLYLSKNVQEIAHRDQLDADEKLNTGKWQCQSGKWHTGSTCVCDKGFEQIDNNTVRLLEN